MIPPPFNYAAPTSLEEALAILAEHGDEAKLLAGGHSLLPLMKLRLAAPELLVDLARIPELSYIRLEGDHISIGAMTTHHMLESSALLLGRVPLLPLAAGLVGDMQVRNRGTLAGSLAHADPAADLPAVLTALNATIVTSRQGDGRAIPIDDFFVDIWTSLLEPVEIIREIQIPLLASPRGHYEKFAARASDWAIVAAAASLDVSDGVMRKVSIVLANMAGTPARARAAEDVLEGQAPSSELLRSASARAADGLDPSPELKAGPEYKRHLARVLTFRALTHTLGTA